MTKDVHHEHPVAHFRQPPRYRRRQHRGRPPRSSIAIGRSIPTWGSSTWTCSNGRCLPSDGSPQGPRWPSSKAASPPRNRARSGRPSEHCSTGSPPPTPTFLRPDVERRGALRPQAVDRHDHPTGLGLRLRAGRRVQRHRARQEGRRCLHQRRVLRRRLACLRPRLPLHLLSPTGCSSSASIRSPTIP